MPTTETIMDPQNLDNLSKIGGEYDEYKREKESHKIGTFSTILR